MLRYFYAFFILGLISASTHAQDYSARIDSVVNRIDNPYTLIEEYQACGFKDITQPGIDSTRRWIEAKMDVFNFEFERDTFVYGPENYNLVYTKKSQASDPWIYAIGHYDSELNAGANDNGTGVAALLEMARVLDSVGLNKNLRIIFFSAEERGLRGSQHYVQNELEQTVEEVDVVLNLDQLGGTQGSSDNNKIKCEYDNSGAASNDLKSFERTLQLEKVTQLYTSLQPVKTKAFGSDYISFENQGYVITGLYQFSDYPFYHTAQDSLQNVDTKATREVIKAAVAFVAYRGGVGGTSAVVSTSNKLKVKIYPQPNKGHFTLQLNNTKPTEIKIYSAHGKLLLHRKVIGTEIAVNHTLSLGWYVVEIIQTNDFARQILLVE